MQHCPRETMQALDRTGLPFFFFDPLTGSFEQSSNHGFVLQWEPAIEPGEEVVEGALDSFRKWLPV